MSLSEAVDKILTTKTSLPDPPVDPATNATRAIPKTELETAVGSAGNVFLAYLKK